jgi:hypothetical protein
MFDSPRRLTAATAVLAVAFGVVAWTRGDLGLDDPWRLVRDLGLVGLDTVPLLAVRRNALAVLVLFYRTYHPSLEDVFVAVTGPAGGVSTSPLLNPPTVRR